MSVVVPRRRVARAAPPGAGAARRPRTAVAAAGVTLAAVLILLALGVVALLTVLPLLAIVGPLAAGRYPGERVLTARTRHPAPLRAAPPRRPALPRVRPLADRLACARRRRGPPPATA